MPLLDWGSTAQANPQETLLDRILTPVGNKLRQTVAPLRAKGLAWTQAHKQYFPEEIVMKEPEKFKLDWATVSPYRGLRTATVPVVKRTLKPVIGEQKAEDVAYGLRGAYNIPTYALDPAFALRTLRGERPTDQYEATTTRQKGAERIGQAAMGQLLAAGVPMAGLPAGTGALTKAGVALSAIPTRAGMGALLGTGISMLPLVGKAAQGGQVTKQDFLNQLKEGAVRGVENSWMLAFTDLATDKVLQTGANFLSKSNPTAARILNSLVQKEAYAGMEPLKQYVRLGGTAGLTKASLFAKGMAKFFERAMTEVPAENAMWVAMGQLKGDDQRKFVDAYIKDLPGTIIGNALWAGGQTLWGGGPALKGTDMKQIRQSAWKALRTVGKPSEQGAITFGAKVGGEWPAYKVKPAGKSGILDVVGPGGTVAKTYPKGQMKAAQAFADEMNAIALKPEPGIKREPITATPEEAKAARRPGEVIEEMPTQRLNFSDAKTADLEARYALMLSKKKGYTENIILDDIRTNRQAAIDSDWTTDKYHDFLKTLISVEPKTTNKPADERAVTKALEKLAKSRMTPENEPSVPILEYKATSPKYAKEMAEWEANYADSLRRSGDAERIISDSVQMGRNAAKINKMSNREYINYLKGRVSVNNFLIEQNAVEAPKQTSAQPTKTKPGKAPVQPVAEKVTGNTITVNGEPAKIQDETAKSYLVTFADGRLAQVPKNAPEVKKVKVKEILSAEQLREFEQAMAPKPAKKVVAKAKVAGPLTPEQLKEFEGRMKAGLSTEEDMELIDLKGKVVKEIKTKPKRGATPLFINKDGEILELPDDTHIGALNKAGLVDDMEDSSMYDWMNTNEVVRAVATKGGVDLDFLDKPLSPEAAGNITEQIAKTLAQGKTVYADVRDVDGTVLRSQKITDPTQIAGLISSLGRTAQVVSGQSTIPADQQTDAFLRAKEAAMAMPPGPTRDNLLDIMATAEQNKLAELEMEANPQKYQDSINLLRTSLSDKGKEALEVSLQMGKIDPELQAYFNKDKISWAEIEKFAKDANILSRVDIKTRDEVRDLAASIKATRNMMVAANEAIGKTGALDDRAKIRGAADLFMKAMELSTLNNAKSRELGQVFNSLKATASPAERTVLDEVIKELGKTDATQKQIQKALKGKDLSNDRDVVAVLKELKPPELNKVFTEFRYINLLSSPKTHIVNLVSNVLQAVLVTPMRKLYSGVIDYFMSGLPGYQRQHYVSEVPAYIKGLVNSFGEAWTRAGKAYKGEEAYNRPDVAVQQTMGKPAKLEGTMKVLEPANQFMAFINRKFGYIPAALRASDAFWSTVIRNGQVEAMMTKAIAESPGMKEADIDALRATFSDKESANYKAANAYAEDALFRGELDTSGKRGWALGLIDDATNALYAARARKRIGPILSAFIPFVKTPMEILKQGLEYSPLGFANLPGSKDYADQLGKAMFGSTVTAMAYWLAHRGDSTWAAPKGEKEKERFYASGRKPYSIKIGDTWIGYSKLGPLAYPIAMAAAWKWYHDQDPSRVTDNALERAWQTFLGMMQFFGDQSYMTGFEDLVGLIDNPTEAGVRAFTNIPRQTVPLTSLLGWVTRIIDPIYRDPNATVSPLDSSFVNNIISGWPVFSMGVQPYLDPKGEPSKRRMILLNALSPVEVSPASNAFFDTYFTMNNKQKEFANIKNALKERRITKEQAVQAVEDLVASVNEINKRNAGVPMTSGETNVGMTDEALYQIEPWLRNVLGVSPQTGTPMVPFLNEYYMKYYPTNNPLPGPAPTPATVPTTAPTALPTGLPTAAPSTPPIASPSALPTFLQPTTSQPVQGNTLLNWD